MRNNFTTIIHFHSIVHWYSWILVLHKHEFLFITVFKSLHAFFFLGCIKSTIFILIKLRSYKEFFVWNDTVSVKVKGWINSEGLFSKFFQFRESLRFIHQNLILWCLMLRPIFWDICNKGIKIIVSKQLGKVSVCNIWYKITKSYQQILMRSIMLKLQYIKTNTYLYHFSWEFYRCGIHHELEWETLQD